jgi:hypothetical protein
MEGLSITIRFWTVISFNMLTTMRILIDHRVVKLSFLKIVKMREVIILLTRILQ